MKVNFAPPIDFPDLVFGLVGPIGVDLDYIQTAIADALRSFNYKEELVRLTGLMLELKSDVTIDDTDMAKNYDSKIRYANDLRKKYGANDILAALGIVAIKRLRSEKHSSESRPTAYIIRQLKTPEETRLLRAVFGRQYIQVSIYGDPKKREDYLVAQLKMRSRGTKDEKEARKGAEALMERDSKEDEDYGQNISNAFPLGDVFVDSSNREAATASIQRFIDALFGSNEISPTREEYGMYLAKSASLRSNDLSRQVGAAIFSATGEVISVGSNEVPKAGGGTYWTGDPLDSRDIRVGYDPNELNKVEIFAEIVSRLLSDKFLSDELLDLKEAKAVVEKLLSKDDGRRYRDSRVMDIIEFGRIIHAEMSAICDAARNGTSVRGATLYSTTFPCHLCAKHIVASGIKRVVYLEPYPKSYAEKLHSDSIQIDDPSETNKVSFQPFMGISPFRYRDLFEKGKRKGSDGAAMKWKSDPRRPMIDVVVPPHYEAEAVVALRLAELIAKKEAEAAAKAEDGEDQLTGAN
ncbi:anti-phage dCTP deaminase [Microvirga massiliensis]|uniref:anti-phage dCTP deaminase n=1 Tax=Microvirga massiliensis TaxID=1033741 RepID=UPI00062BAFC8|nr:anti-phage dCTP deaminase [Microvirga massiliensis]